MMVVLCGLLFWFLASFREGVWTPYIAQDVARWYAQAAVRAVAAAAARTAALPNRARKAARERNAPLSASNRRTGSGEYGVKKAALVAENAARVFGKPQGRLAGRVLGRLLAVMLVRGQAVQRQNRRFPPICLTTCKNAVYVRAMPCP